MASFLICPTLDGIVQTSVMRVSNSTQVEMQLGVAIFIQKGGDQQGVDSWSYVQANVIGPEIMSE